MKKLVGIMMLAAMVFFAAADANREQEAGPCMRSTSDVPAAGNPCICSKNCACAGKCILNAVDGDDIKTCFVECVLKNDCGSCPGPLPASLYKTLRLNVTRPDVSRSFPEKEWLVIGVAVEPQRTGAARFEVYLNIPEGEEVDKTSAHYVWTFEGTPNEISERLLRMDISGVLRTMGAHRDETIVVSLVPRDWGERVTIVSVKIDQGK